MRDSRSVDVSDEVTHSNDSRHQIALICCWNEPTVSVQLVTVDRRNDPSLCGCGILSNRRARPKAGKCHCLASFDIRISRLRSCCACWIATPRNVAGGARRSFCGHCLGLSFGRLEITDARPQFTFRASLPVLFQNAAVVDGAGRGAPCWSRAWHPNRSKAYPRGPEIRLAPSATRPVSWPQLPRRGLISW